MIRLTMTLAASAAIAAGFALVPAPAAAQATGQQEVAVFGTDPCPRSTESAIVICHRYPESQRYRLPKNQQLQGTLQQRQSWAKKSQPLMTAGATGVGSCSAVGPGGREGCLVQSIKQEKEDAKEQAQSQQAPEQ